MQLGENLFGGSIPQSFGRLHNLAHALNLSGNKLTGEIPGELGKLSKLQILDISVNNLTGSLAPVSDLLSLLELKVSYNSFSGQIPQALMKFLSSAPSSFSGNPGLCIPCQLGSDVP